LPLLEINCRGLFVDSDGTRSDRAFFALKKGFFHSLLRVSYWQVQRQKTNRKLTEENGRSVFASEQLASASANALHLPRRASPDQRRRVINGENANRRLCSRWTDTKEARKIDCGLWPGALNCASTDAVGMVGQAVPTPGGWAGAMAGLGPALPSTLTGCSPFPLAHER